MDYWTIYYFNNFKGFVRQIIIRQRKTSTIWSMVWNNWNATTVSLAQCISLYMKKCQNIDTLKCILSISINHKQFYTYRYCLCVVTQLLRRQAPYWQISWAKKIVVKINEKRKSKICNASRIVANGNCLYKYVHNRKMQ